MAVGLGGCTYPLATNSHTPSHAQRGMPNMIWFYIIVLYLFNAYMWERLYARFLLDIVGAIEWWMIHRNAE